jgi:transposase-like protein
MEDFLNRKTSWTWIRLHVQLARLLQYGYDYFVRKGFLKRKLVKISRYTCSDCGCEYEVEELFVRFKKRKGWF